MRFKPILSACLAAALLIPCALPATADDDPTAPEAAETASGETALPEFTDIEGHWAHDAVVRFREAGAITDESDRFRPDEAMTRAEMAILLQRVMRYQTASDELFLDLEEEWYAKAILQLRAADVMRGDENNLAHPNDPITREEAAALIARAFLLADSEEPAPLPYPDAEAISDWACGSIEAMTARGFLHGSDGGNFFPQDNLTRAEAVTILDNMITAFFYAPGEYDYRPYEGLADFVIIASDDVTVLNFDIGGTIFLAEGIDYDSIRLKSCSHTGWVMQYTADGYIRRLKASSRIVPINEDLPTLSHDPARFVKDERGIMHYEDPDVTTYFGVDVSSWQYEIDWQKLKEEGVYFAFVRAGYRGYESGALVKDTYFDANMKGAIAAGIHVGVYFFSQALNAEEAEEEARFVIEALKGYRITYPVVFDWETISQATARTKDMETKKLCEATNAFCSTIAAAGYAPMVYSNQSISLLYYELGRIQEYPFWYAEYRDRPTFYYDFDIWQYGASAHLDGVPKAEIDVNISFVDFSQLLPQPVTAAP